MKIVIGIVVPGDIEFDETGLEKGIGGSETWAIQIAQALSRKGDYVIVFCKCSYWHFDHTGVEWIPIELLDSRIQYQHFDHIIMSRHYSGFINKIADSKCCDNIVIQSHDWSVGPFWQLTDSTWRYVYYEEDEELRHPLVKKFIALSDWHIGSMIKESHIPREMITIIPNGIDPKLFEGIDLDAERDHHILWSSRPERGCDMLVNDIAPIVRRSIPDFKVEIASYDPIQDRFKDKEDIIILGKLNKVDLYREMAKHCCWFYPSIYPETFNITSIESVMCNVDLILPIQHGMATTFEYFKSIGMTNRFMSFFVKASKVETDNAIEEAARLIVNSIQRYGRMERRQLRDCMRRYISLNYTWDKIAELYHEMWLKL